MGAKSLAFLGIAAAFVIGSGTFVAQSVASVEVVGPVHTSSGSYVSKTFTPIRREQTGPGQFIWTADEDCPCKTTQGVCRRDDNGKPATNC